MRRAAWFAVVLMAAGCGGSAAKLQPVGGVCSPQADGTSTECADGLCIALDATSTSGVCTRDCSKDGTCPEDYACKLSGRFGRVCLKDDRGCAVDEDCPAGHRCDAATKTCFIAVSRQLCAPCEDDAQCPAGGHCFTALGSGESFCTSVCDENGNCPEGYACSTLPDGTSNQCLPKAGSCDQGKALCAPCRGDNECGTALDLCVRNVVSGEQFCGTQCAPDAGAPCPDGFSCQDLRLDVSGTGPFQCVPNSNSCAGYCDSTDLHTQVLQCGLGRTCDLGSHQCQRANDGRMCSPCETNDDCAKTGNPNNACIVNTSVNSQHNGETFCAEPCPADDGDAVCLSDLGPGFSCTQVGQERFCTPNKGTCLSGLGQLGDDCSANSSNDCITGVCLVAGINGLQSICSATCAVDTECGDAHYRCCQTERITPTDGGAAFDTYDCSSRNPTDTGPQSGQGVCAPPGGAFGDDCSPGHAPCTSGACLDLGTAELCSQFCDTQGCPSGFVCQGAVNEATGEAQSVCFPQGGGLPGGDCTFGPAACASGLCIKKESTGSVCTVGCTTASDCPDNWTCVDDPPTVGPTQIPACIPPDLQ